MAWPEPLQRHREGRRGGGASEPLFDPQKFNDKGTVMMIKFNDYVHHVTQISFLEFKKRHAKLTYWCKYNIGLFQKA